MAEKRKGFRETDGRQGLRETDGAWSPLGKRGGGKLDTSFPLHIGTTDGRGNGQFHDFYGNSETRITEDENDRYVLLRKIKRDGREGNQWKINRKEEEGTESDGNTLKELSWDEISEMEGDLTAWHPVKEILLPKVSKKDNTGSGNACKSKDGTDCDKSSMMSSLSDKGNVENGSFKTHWYRISKKKSTTPWNYWGIVFRRR